MSEMIRRMFDRISGRYDLLNHVLSLNRDKAWRRKAVRYAGPASCVLDLCGGTGDLILSWQRMWGKPKQAVLVDFSLNMLKRSLHKKDCAPSVCADALCLPLRDHCADLVLCGFGMRNLDDLDRGLREVRRVLRPGGTAVILDFFRPENAWTRFFYGVAAPVFIPLCGVLLSGKMEAYRYLVRSVRGFVSAREYCLRAGVFGLSAQLCLPLDGGIAHLIVLHAGEM